MASPMTLYHSLFPNPQHTVSVYNIYVSRISLHGRKGKEVAISRTEEYLEIFLERYCRYWYRTRYWCNMQWSPWHLICFCWALSTMVLSRKWLGIIYDTIGKITLINQTQSLSCQWQSTLQADLCETAVLARRMSPILDFSWEENTQIHYVTSKTYYNSRHKGDNIRGQRLLSSFFFGYWLIW